jgi:hypothetical protein
MKVNLKYLEEGETLIKKLTSISEIEIRQGFLEFWIRNDEYQPRLELSIKVDSVISMICFKHIIEKANNKIRQRKAKIKRGPYKRSSSR